MLNEPRFRQVDGQNAPSRIEQMVRNGAADAIRGAGDERDRPVRLRR
jgi:hypothetical protein